ncbi:MAG: hypothetical protein LLG93_07650 [Deltaproteobacteria bacterium]|nr:hypothetical protein [Deltaproteobacteria bacterium]
MAIDATVSGASANSYMTVANADARAPAYPNSALWLALTTPQKEAMLQRATRLVDRYRRWELRLVSTQRLAFPRACDKAGAIPEGVLQAVMEFLDMSTQPSLTTLKTLQAEGVTSAAILGQSMSFGGSDGKTDQSGLPAGARSELDELYEQQPVVGYVDHGCDPTSVFG